MAEGELMAGTALSLRDKVTERPLAWDTRLLKRLGDSEAHCRHWPVEGGAGQGPPHGPRSSLLLAPNTRPQREDPRRTLGLGWVWAVV